MLPMDDDFAPSLTVEGGGKRSWIVNPAGIDRPFPAWGVATRSFRVRELCVGGCIASRARRSLFRLRSSLSWPDVSIKDPKAYAIFPALGFTVLGYLDENLTTLILNRPSNNLKKPPGYHLDIFVRGLLLMPACGILGLPMSVASTVPSITHLISLTLRGTWKYFFNFWLLYIILKKRLK